MREAHVRRALYIAIAAALIAGLVRGVAPSGPTASVAAMRPQSGNAVLIEGLHIALPRTMQKFPDGIVPLP